MRRFFLIPALAGQLACGSNPADLPLGGDGVSAVVVEVTVGTEVGAPVPGASLSAMVAEPNGALYGPHTFGPTDDRGHSSSVLDIPQGSTGQKRISVSVLPPDTSLLLPDTVNASAFFRRNVLTWQLDTVRISATLRSPASR